MKPSERVELPQRKAAEGSTSTPPAEDRVEISEEGAFVASLISEISRMPETRQEVVGDVMQKVRGGNYPPPALIDGLVRLMGDSLKTEGE